MLERAPLQASCQRMQVPLGHRKCYVSSRKDPKCRRLVASMGSPAGHKQGKWAAVGGGCLGGTVETGASAHVELSPRRKYKSI